MRPRRARGPDDLAGSLRAIIGDLTRIAEAGPNATPADAAMLERISGEVAEAAAMMRAQPGWPPKHRHRVGFADHPADPAEYLPAPAGPAEGGPQ
jgi:hypothetical protein